MKMTAIRPGFLAACQLVNMAVSPRDVKPILRNLKVSVNGENCELEATDLEIGLKVRVCGIAATEPGDALLPAEKLLRILREMPDNEVVIDADETGVKVTGQSADFEMGGEDAESYPSMKGGDKGKTVEIKAGLLRTLLAQTSFAMASTENSRFGATTGLMLECDGERLTAVATDGRRLAVATAPVDTGEKIDTVTHNPPVIPAKAVRILLSLLDDADETVSLTLCPNEAVFSTSRATLLTRLVEGRFPAYRQVLPKSGPIRFVLPGKHFLAALRQAAIMTDQESNRVDCVFKGDRVTLSAKGAASGKSKVDFGLPEPGTGSVTIAFDPKFLADFLKVVPAESVVAASFVDGQSAGLFSVGEDYRYVVVPLVSTVQGGA